jgi:hypothetical protein
MIVIDYEAKRQENILRNQAKLAELHIQNTTNLLLVGGKRKTSTPENKSIVTSGGHGAGEEDEGMHELAWQRRASLRSRRNQPSQLVHPSAFTSSASEATEEYIRTSKTRTSGNKRVKTRPAPLASSSASKLAPDSTKNISCAAVAFVDNHLGLHILPPEGSGAMKAAVVYGLAGTSCRFNKYSGICEFANAIVLFVNVGGENYANVFSRLTAKSSIVEMEWFAQPTMHPETPVISRLVSANEPIVLFCRVAGQPFVCCGRLRHQSHQFNARPMKFVFQLIDSKALIDDHWNNFREIIGSEDNLDS